MNTYKLKLPLPGAPAGTEVEVKRERYFSYVFLLQGSSYSPEPLCHIPNNEFDKWLEPVKWGPKEGDSFHYINIFGDIAQASALSGFSAKHYILGIYETEYEAIKVRDLVREYVKSLQ